MSEREFRNGTYFGDGVYAGFDGYHLVLRLGSHLNSEGEICLEDQVALKLMDYAQKTFNFRKYGEKAREDLGEE